MSKPEAYTLVKSTPPSPSTQKWPSQAAELVEGSTLHAMGNAIPRHAAAPSQQAYIDKPEKYLTEDMRATMVLARIGNGRFLKSYRCKEDGKLMLVKVYVKQDQDEDLEIWRQGIDRIAAALRPRHECPNVQPYLKAFTGRRPGARGVTGAAYCIRQHFWSNVLDRLGTRPFLSSVEKRWVVYQLLRAIDQCHERGVCHGDITCENVMVTSWTWITLVDFASYKPIYLPDDGPEFDYYFCAGSRPRCYVAPERFWLSSDAGSSTSTEDASAQNAGNLEVATKAERKKMASARTAQLEPAMDIFSLGCVIAEIFRGGASPTLDLATLMRILRDPSSESFDINLDALEPTELRLTVRTMLSRDPSKRGNAKSHLHRLEQSGVLPPEFSSFVYDFFACILLDAHSPDDRIALVCANYGRAMIEMAGVDDADGAHFFHAFCYDEETTVSAHALAADTDDRPSCDGDDLESKGLTQAEGLTPAPALSTRRGIALDFLTSLSQQSGAIDEQIANVEPDENGDDPILDELMDGCADDIDALMHISTDELLKRTEMLLRAFNGDPESTKKINDAARARKSQRANSERLEKGASVKHDSAYAGTFTEESRASSPSLVRRADGGSLILLAQLVCVTMRHARWPRTKLVALALLLRFGLFLDDEARLQRLVPHIVSLLDDVSAAVRAAAVRALAACVSRVDTFAASDAALFPKYVYPSLDSIAADSEEAVVVTFAESVATFAEAARRFLEIAHDLNSKGVLPGAADDQPQQLGTAASQPSESVSQTTSSQDAVASPAGSSNVAASDLTGDGAAAASVRQQRGPRERAVYDQALTELRQHVRRWVVALLSEASAMAKHALLCDLPRLCVFFGREQTQDVLMPHLFTFLNDSDWSLRDAFCAHAAAVGAFLGRDAAEGLVSPCVGQALVDTEPLVIARALRSLASLVDLGLLGRAAVLDFAFVQPASATPLLLHPKRSVRVAAAAYLAAACCSLGNAADASALLFEPALLGENRRFLVSPICVPSEYMGHSYAVAEHDDDGGTSDNSPLEQLFEMEARVSRGHVEFDEGSPSPLTIAILQSLREPVDDATYHATLRGGSVEGENESLRLMSEYLAHASRHFLQHRTQTRRGTFTDDVVRSDDSHASPMRWTHVPSVMSGSSLQADDRNDSGRGRRETVEGRLVGGMATRLHLPHSQALLVPDQKFVSLLKAARRQRPDATEFDEDDVAYDNDDLLRARCGVLDGDSVDARSAVSWDADDFVSATDPTLGEPRPGSGLKAAKRNTSSSSLLSPPSGTSSISRDVSASAVEGRPSKPIYPAKEVAGVPDEQEDAVAHIVPDSQPPTPRLTEADDTSSPDAEQNTVKSKRTKLMASPQLSAMTSLGRRVFGLGVPPLPPELGCLRQPNDGRPFSWYATSLALDAAETARRVDWRPKAGVVVATLTEHKAAVCRLAIAQDQSFFASASHDGKCLGNKCCHHVTYVYSWCSLTSLCLVMLSHATR